MSLRPLEEADLDRVMELEHELFGPGAWSRAVYRQELAAPGRYYVAAEHEGRLVGYAGIALAEECEVMTVGVAAEHRGRGVGAALLAALVAAARDARARRVFLEVRAGNDGAQRLYERAGFTVVGTRRRYYGDEDAVVMRLVLRRGQGDLTTPPGEG